MKTLNFSLLTGATAVFATGSFDFDWMENNSQSVSPMSISPATGDEYDVDPTSLSGPVSPVWNAEEEWYHEERQSPQPRSFSTSVEYDEERLEDVFSSLALSSSSSLSSHSSLPLDDCEQPFEGATWEAFPYVTPPTCVRSEGSKSSESCTSEEDNWWDTQTYH